MSERNKRFPMMSARAEGSRPLFLDERELLVTKSLSAKCLRNVRACVGVHTETCMLQLLLFAAAVAAAGAPFLFWA